jgi:prepilin peptidase CpaA
LAIVAMGLHGFPAALWQNALVFAAVLVVGTFAFGRGWLGGGDVKLLAVVGLWVGFRGAIALLAAVFIAGGVIAAVYIAKGAMKGVARHQRKKARNVAYGVAIAAGALVTFAVQRNPADPNPYITSLQRAEAH